MSFLNPLFLLGVAALAAPILVHLVRRTRARRVEFPALLFMRQVPQKTIRRRTLQNLLLLILRCLAVLLIVLAFTRPFFSERISGLTTGGGRSQVILVDSSLSMRRQQMFADAQRRAETLITEAGQNDRLALVSFGKRFELLSRFTKDKSKVRAALKGLSAGWEGTDYEQALRGAEMLFREEGIGANKEIALISDFQATGWNQASATFKLANDIQLKTLDVDDTGPTANVAITGVEARGMVFGQKYQENLAVHLSNFGDSPREQVRITLQMNEQTVDKRDITLGARDSRIVEFGNFNLAEGANRCAIEIESDDFVADNQFFFTIRRESPAKALIIESATRGRSDSFYLQNALTMSGDLPFEFSLKTAGAADPTSISDYSLIILNDAGPLSAALAAAFTKFAEMGGQLIIATGPRTEAENFNQTLGQVSPALLQQSAVTSQGDSLAISDIQFDHPIFSVFRQGGRLTTARVVGYFRSEPKTGAAVIARFEDGAPALMEARTGEGRVLLFTSSLGTSWNDLPLTPHYLPFLHQMVRYARDQEESSWHAVGQTFTVAREADSLPAVDTPSGARLTENRLTPDGDLLVTAREPGFYRLRYDTKPGFAAVNPEGTEGDFTKLNFADFIAGVSGGAKAPVATDASVRATNEEKEARQKVWWSLLLVALGLLVTESLLTRRTKVVKMVG